MTILLDVDGVLLDLCRPLHDFVKERYGVVTDDKSIVSWEFTYCLGIPKEDVKDMWERVWTQPLKPYPGALNFIAKLKEKGYRVVALSTRPVGPAKLAAKRDFRQLGIEWHVVDEAVEKTNRIHKDFAGADVMIEDNPETAVTIGRYTKLKSLLLTRPWNEGTISVTYDYTRARDYSHAIELIR